MQKPCNKENRNFYCNLIASYAFRKRRYEYYITESKWKDVDRRFLTSWSGLSFPLLLHHQGIPEKEEPNKPCTGLKYVANPKER